jgi:hypothetical protein
VKCRTEKISQAAMEFMAALEADEDYDGATIAEVGIVVHLCTTEEDGDIRDGAPIFCTNDSRIYQTGLFRWAVRSAENGEAGGEVPGPDDD